MAMELLGIATGAESESIRFAAIRDALDRGGGTTVKAALEVSATSEPRPYEEMLMGIGEIAKLTRAESRAQRGLPTQPCAVRVERGPVGIEVAGMPVR
jgi:hypothetical protein